MELNVTVIQDDFEPYEMIFAIFCAQMLEILEKHVEITR